MSEFEARLPHTDDGAAVVGREVTVVSRSGTRYAGTVVATRTDNGDLLVTIEVPEDALPELLPEPGPYGVGYA